MPKSSTKSEAVASIKEYEVLSALNQIMLTSANDSARVTAATRLLDYLEKNKVKSEGSRIYDQLINFKNTDDDTANNQMEGIS